MNSRDSDQSVLPSPSGPVLCSTGCGFFGNPNTDNLCSKCNNDRKRRQAAAETATSTSSPATTPATATATATPSPALSSISSLVTSTSSSATPTLAPLAISKSVVSSTSSPTVDAAAILSPAPSSTATTAVAAATSTSSPTDVPTSTATPKKKLNRCGICSKKVGITYFNCRCDDTLLLCSAHRLPHQHDCKFDLKKLHTANLTKANPEIVREKMEKI